MKHDLYFLAWLRNLMHLNKWVVWIEVIQPSQNLCYLWKFWKCISWHRGHLYIHDWNGGTNYTSALKSQFLSPRVCVVGAIPSYFQVPEPRRKLGRGIFHIYPCVLNLRFSYIPLRPHPPFFILPCVLISIIYLDYNKKSLPSYLKYSSNLAITKLLVM